MITLAPDWHDFKKEGGILTTLELAIVARAFPDIPCVTSAPEGNLGETLEDDMLADQILNFMAELRRSKVSVESRQKWTQTCWRESVQVERGMPDAAEWTLIRERLWCDLGHVQQFCLCKEGLAEMDGKPTAQAVYTGRRY